MSMNRICRSTTRIHRVCNGGQQRSFAYAGFIFRHLCSRAPRQAWWTPIFLIALVAFGLCQTPVWAQTTKGKKDTTQKPQPIDDLKIDSEKLPANFQPPQEKLAIMELEKPIASKEELDKLRKDYVSKYHKARNEVDNSDAAKKVIEKSIRHKLATLTLKESLPNLPQLHKQFMEQTAPVANPAQRPANLLAFNTHTNEEIVKQIPELLKNNFYVRLHAVLILGEMDYGPAFAPLLEVIQAKDIHEDEVSGQPPAIKIAAAMGLIRILQFGNPPPIPKDRAAIARAVVDQLADAKSHWWYQIRLIEVLRYCDIPGVDALNNNKPFVVDSLTSVIKDADRSWLVRTKACYALGRVPLPPSVVTNDVVMVVADCALQLSTAAAANPKKAAWKACFWDIYLAFHESDAGKIKDRDAENKLAGGFLARIKSVAQPAYNLIVPLVNDVLNDKAPDASGRQKLESFVRPGGPVLAAPADAKDKPAATNGKNKGPNT